MTNDLNKAKLEAYRYVNTPLGMQLRQLFKDIVPDPVTCECGKVIEQIFNMVMLKYTSRSQCNRCLEKEHIESTKSEEHNKSIQFAKFIETKEEIISRVLYKCGVPLDMTTASTGNLPESLLGKLKNNKNFFFTSVNPGPGKTYTAIALLYKYIDCLDVAYHDGRYKIRLGVNPIFITVPELLMDIRSSFDETNPEQEIDLINKYAETPFLILDDMGVEKVSEWALQTLYIIINRRHDNSRKTTIITSNLTLDEMSKRFNDRIGSRINGMCKTLVFKGKDKRMV